MSEVRPYRYESSMKILHETQGRRQKWETSRFWHVRIRTKSDACIHIVSDCEPVVTDTFVSLWNAFAVEGDNELSRVINQNSDEISQVNWSFIEGNRTFWLDTRTGGVTPAD